MKEEAAIIRYNYCAIGIHALLPQEHRLAGSIGLNRWLSQEDNLRANANATALSTPVFLGHTKDDDFINISYGQDLRDKLTDMGMKVTWHDYEDGGTGPTSQRA